MDEHQIKTAKTIKLKPNGIFLDPSIPFPYQRRAPLLMLLRPRMILGDDVGLGKTLETILAISYLKSTRPETRFLVLTEQTALRQWAGELDWLAPSLTKIIVNAQTHPDIPTRVRAMRTHGRDIILTGYSMLYKYAKYLKEGLGKRWVFIADEPDYFRSVDSAMHQAAFELVNGEGGAARAYALTAAIIGNRLEEAYGTIRIVSPETFPTYKHFEQKYCKVRRIKGHRRIVGYKNLQEFRQQIEPIYYGRLQTDPEVEQDLPEPIPKDVEIVLTKEQSWKVVEATDKLIATPEGEVKQLHILPAMTMAQLLCDDPRSAGYDLPSAKTEAVLETLQHSLRGERVVIFAKFRKVIDVLERELRAKGLESVRITGAENWDQKFASQVRFMSDGPDHCPIVLMTRAGARAINLQKSGFLIFMDLPWSFDIYRQVVGRLKRTGSTYEKVIIMRMMAVLHPDVAKEVGTELTIDHHTRNVVLGKKATLWNAVVGDVDEVVDVNSDLLEVFKLVKAAHRKV